MQLLLIEQVWTYKCQENFDLLWVSKIFFFFFLKGGGGKKEKNGRGDRLVFLNSSYGHEFNQAHCRLLGILGLFRLELQTSWW